MHITDIVDNLVPCNGWAVKSRVTYIRYIKNGRMMNEHQAMLSLLEKLSKNTLAMKTPVGTDLDDPILYIPSWLDVLLMIQGADLNVKNDHMPSPFHANTFYRHARALLDEL